ncbi:TetR/AcrR family transcriptional regulator [Bittarella massiliensis (ex Durand et al. 2017)]|uniref:TetR/AcrR family transcriptional regulator n=1 Tax=Bittarella massiliensis (ex Durand et al. 2017) TaxID=1720313 RepID=UPI001AA1A78E|nr:TetR/AcrR family transcriptional regulator [Bittarella massiliensis (ex Durand et al. 2017)]MBO1679618.1 TetR/AcrR family transcriptional regulator [Bittarella massiliensis (ex Durand et al. 2017)]
MLLTAEEKEARRVKIMEACFDCYCENGLNETGMKALGEACGMNHSSFYNYFENLDELIVASTAHCMAKVEDEFMEKAFSYCSEDGPVDLGVVLQFLREVPYWTAEKHGKKYRFMYQVYSSPKYLEHGKRFFEGVNTRYAAYAAQLEPRIGIPRKVIEGIIFTVVRASVHFAMFEDAYYLTAQLDLLTAAVQAIAGRNSGEAVPPPKRQ